MAGHLVHPLEEFHHQKRVLLIFSPDTSNEKLHLQHKEINLEPEGIEERDLIVFQIFPREVKTINGQLRDNLSADNLRVHYRVGEHEYRVLLIGKDGGVKYTARDVLEMKPLFDIIDQMPMRQHEMKETK